MGVFWLWALQAQAAAYLGRHAYFFLPVIAWAVLVLPVYAAMTRHVRNQELERDCADLREVLHALEAERVRLRELRRHPATARLLVLASEWEVRNL